MWNFKLVSSTQKSFSMIIVKKMWCLLFNQEHERSHNKILFLIFFLIYCEIPFYFTKSKEFHNKKKKSLRFYVLEQPLLLIGFLTMKLTFPWTNTVLIIHSRKMMTANIQIGMTPSVSSKLNYRKRRRYLMDLRSYVMLINC